MTLFTPDDQRLAAARQRIAYRLKQLHRLAELYRAPTGTLPVDNASSATVISFAIRELEVLAEIVGCETGAGG